METKLYSEKENEVQNHVETVVDMALTHQEIVEPTIEKSIIRTFLLTGTGDIQRATDTSSIYQLGGNVSDVYGYDASCTHIICWDVKRTEKFVAGCAAGKVPDTLFSKKQNKKKFLINK